MFTVRAVLLFLSLSHVSPNLTATGGNVAMIPAQVLGDNMTVFQGDVMNDDACDPSLHS